MIRKRKKNGVRKRARAAQPSGVIAAKYPGKCQPPSVGLTGETKPRSLHRLSQLVELVPPPRGGYPSGTTEQDLEAIADERGLKL